MCRFRWKAKSASKLRGILTRRIFGNFSGHGVEAKMVLRELTADMTQLYLDMKYIGRIPDVFKMDAATINHHCGQNLGNFVFRHALRNVLADLEDYKPVEGREYREIAKEQPIDRVIISCANWLGQTAQDEAFNRGRAEMVEMANTSVVAFGLGVQAHGLTHDQPVKIGPHTTRLVHALSERSAQISVRDELTRRTLEAVGVQNATVTGCPSNYLNGSPTLGASLAARAEAFNLKSWDDVRTAISEVTGGHAKSGDIFRQQMRMMAETPAFYVVQTPDFVGFLMGDRSQISKYYRDNNPFRDEPHKLTRVLKSKTLQFTDVDSWMGFCTTCDMSMGMRIHGTMVPLQSGVPSILIAHDSRTVGLADAMNIPWVSPEQYLDFAKDGPQRLMDVFREKIAGFDENRKVLARTMRDFVVANDLRPQANLLGLT